MASGEESSDSVASGEKGSLKREADPSRRGGLGMTPVGEGVLGRCESGVTGGLAIVGEQ